MSAGEMSVVAVFTIGWNSSLSNFCAWGPSAVRVAETQGMALSQLVPRGSRTGVSLSTERWRRALKLQSRRRRTSGPQYLTEERFDAT